MQGPNDSLVGNGSISTRCKMPFRARQRWIPVRRVGISLLGRSEGSKRHLASLNQFRGSGSEAVMGDRKELTFGKNTSDSG